ncbi:MAG: membrane dipeptidase [Polyangiaceae bacterium]
MSLPTSLRAKPRFRVIDLHVDLPWQLHFKGRDLSLSSGHLTRRALESGPIEGLVLPLYVPDDVRATGPTLADHDAMIGTLDQLFSQHPTLLSAPLSKPSANQVRTWFSFEGIGAMAVDPSQMAAWVKRGVKLVGLAHMHDNALASSSTGKHKAAGLSTTGKQVAKNALDAGALLDVSHLSDASFDDVAKLSKEAGRPIVASHSNARAVCAHPRNLTDDQLRVIAETKGIVGLNLHGQYVSSHAEPTLSDVMDQLDHLIQIAGEDHVAIGSDFDGGIHPPAQLADANQFSTLASAMMQRGYSDEQIAKVFSGNALRVLNAARTP